MTDSSRVLLVSPWFVEPGGVTTVVRQQARYLMAAGHEPVLLLPNGRDTAVPPGGPDLEVLCVEIPSPVVPSHPVRSRLGFVVNLPSALVRLARIVRRRHIGIVNIHFPESHHIVFLLLRRLLGFRLVLSAHGTDLLPGGVAPERYPASLRHVLHGADAIIVPSDDFRRRLVARLPALDRKVRVVPHGVAVPPDDEGREAESDLPECFVVCVGALRQVKGQDVLVRAWADVVKRVPDCHLVLVGEGLLRPELERLCQELHVESRVHLLGERDHAGALAVLRRARLLAMPSRMESFGVVLLEAMAYGKATVATRVGGVPEVVRDGETGVLVPPDMPSDMAGAIVRLLGDPAALARMGQRGCEVARSTFGHDAVDAAYRRALCGG